MNINTLEFMSHELLTSDIYNEKFISNMFVEEKQAGKEISNLGRDLIILQKRYYMIPKVNFGITDFII